MSGSVSARRSASLSARRCSRSRSATPRAISTAAITIESGKPVCNRKSSSLASLVSRRNAAAIVNASSNAHAIRKNPAARPPFRHAMKATTSVNTADVANIRFPIVRHEGRPARTRSARSTPRARGSLRRTIRTSRTPVPEALQIGDLAYEHARRRTADGNVARSTRVAGAVAPTRAAASRTPVPRRTRRTPPRVENSTE